VALPSVVTIGSLAFVLVAGAGYVATASADTSSPDAGSGPTITRPQLPEASKPIPTRRSGSTATVKRPTDLVPHVLVVVFNNTGITGLAAQKASILEGAGWNVASTGNWYGNIPADTVYYPPQLRVAAGKLAKVLHITRLHPAVAPMQFDRLTVIVATG
jgi:LytR cell envelope-related transcriptional attenuator